MREGRQKGKTKMENKSEHSVKKSIDLERQRKRDSRAVSVPKHSMDTAHHTSLPAPGPARPGPASVSFAPLRCMTMLQPLPFCCTMIYNSGNYHFKCGFTDIQSVSETVGYLRKFWVYIYENFLFCILMSTEFFSDPMFDIHTYLKRHWSFRYVFQMHI